MSCIGIEDSFEGILGETHTVKLTTRSVSGILPRGGTILGTRNRGSFVKMIDGLPTYEQERTLIGNEVRAIVDKVLEMGDGDAAIGSVRAFEAGVMDVPWSPNRHCKSRVLPARDVDGCLRILDPGLMPFPRDILEFHVERLRKRAERDRIAFGPDLAVQSVYEMSEPVEKLLPGMR
jgi:methylaspartate mutase epsilon subunit